MELLFRLFDGLPRLGPGSEASTLRALGMLPALPANPAILDLGCGTGAASLILARETGGRVTAVDVHQPFLDDLATKAEAAGLADRVVTRLQSMEGLDDSPGGYDLIWSEGAIYLVGFERGLRLWRPLLRDGGCVCVSEASWLTDKPLEEARVFWEAGYPAMGTVSENIERARAAGYHTLGAFALLRSDWEQGLYGRLRTRMEELRGEPEMAEMIAETEQEIRLYEQHGESYGYVFYALSPE